MCTGLEIAAIGSTILSAGSSLLASDSQADSAQAGLDLQKYMYDTTRSDFAPYRQVGTGALNMLAGEMGVPQYAAPAQAANGMAPSGTAAANPKLPTALGIAMGPIGSVVGRAINQQATQQGGNNLVQMPTAGTGVGGPQVAPGGSTTAQNGMVPGSAFQASPGYQFAFSEGQRAVNADQSAAGMLGSGARLKALTRYGQGIANQEYGNWYNRLANLAGIGQTSTNQLAGYGQNYAANAGNLYGNLGDARASGYVGAGNALAGGIDSWAYNQGRATSSMPYAVGPTPADINGLYGRLGF